MPSARSQHLVAALLTCTLGCSGFADPDAVSQHVARVTGVEYAREGGLEVGPNALRLARLGVAAAGEQSPELLENLRSFEVGIYRVVDPGAVGRSLRATDFSRYEIVLRLETEHKEDVLVLSRSSRGRIRELLTVIDQQSQLTVLQIRGDLEEILTQAVRLAFGRAERDELGRAILDGLEPRQ